MEEMSNFEFIWTEWIVPLAKDLYSQSNYEFKKQCNLEIRDLDTLCTKAERYYQNKRSEVKRAFYGEYHKGDSTDEHRMDFHKIGAIICRTLIEYKVFDFDTEICRKYVDQHIKSYDTDWVVKNALINFRLAFYGSIVFLFQSMLFEYYKSNKKLYDALCKKKSLDLYQTVVGGYNKENLSDKKVKESFENCIVLDLAKRDIGNRSFDYFMYAIILYQLEEHNKNLLLNGK